MKKKTSPGDFFLKQTEHLLFLHIFFLWEQFPVFKGTSVVVNPTVQKDQRVCDYVPLFQTLSSLSFSNIFQQKATGDVTDSLLHVQLCAAASKNGSQRTSLLYSNRSLHAMTLSFPFQDLQQLPFSTVCKDLLIHTCFCHVLWLLNSTLFYPSANVLFSLSIPVSNLSLPFFKSEVLELLGTLPTPLSQNFISFASLLP